MENGEWRMENWQCKLNFNIHSQFSNFNSQLVKHYPIQDKIAEAETMLSPEDEWHYKLNL